MLEVGYCFSKNLHEGFVSMFDFVRKGPSLPEMFRVCFRHSQLGKTPSRQRIRNLVAAKARGNVNLQHGYYVSEEDIEKVRQRVNKD